MLSSLPAVTDPRALVDAAALDDAALFEISADRALVATVDFFTPIVDDPYLFGALAAANAFSDVYAMGGTPLFALNLVAWPREPEMLDLLSQTIRGGSDKAAEAGAFVLGGHSIDDREPKFGMVVLGEVNPNLALTTGRVCEGDRLVLTKPIGTGILATALKQQTIDETAMSDAIASMTTLNRDAARVVLEMRDKVSGATDVTGFGLVGHLKNLLGTSGHGARIRLKDIPLFARTRQLAEQEFIPGGTQRNYEASLEYTSWSRLTEAERLIVADAQTSGGLLVSVAADAADELVERLRAAAVPAATVIGDVVSPQANLIEVTA